MAVEQMRGCGYRKVGALYLVGDPGGYECNRLPIPTHICPTCSGGIKPSRGWTWVFPYNLFAGNHTPCICNEDCPTCHPMKLGRRVGLIWVGTSYYSSQSFAAEAKTMGISKRIGAIPRDLVLGESWVLIGHRFGALYKSKITLLKNKPGPGIFYAFKPLRVEKIITETQSKDEKAMLKLEKRGIHPIIVPDNDPDHQNLIIEDTVPPHELF